MNLFDFLMVLDSIIIGLGLAEVLTGLGQLLRSRGATRLYGVHAVFVAQASGVYFSTGGMLGDSVAADPPKPLVVSSDLR